MQTVHKRRLNIIIISQTCNIWNMLREITFYKIKYFLPSATYFILFDWMILDYTLVKKKKIDTWKIIYVSYYFSTLNSNKLLELLYHVQIL